ALQDDISTSEEEKRKYLEIVSRKSNGLKQLLDELFNMAKIEANEFLLKEELLDFAEVTRESIIEFLPELKRGDRVNSPYSRRRLLDHGRPPKPYPNHRYFNQECCALWKGRESIRNRIDGNH